MFEILKKCFSINLNDYEYINVDLEINKVVFGTFVALIISIIVFNLYRGNIKRVVSQLARHGAKSEDKAKTLAELGLDKSRAIKKLLSGENMLTKVVGRVGESVYGYDEYMALTKEEKKESDEFDVSEARFYIREEQADRAANIIEKYNTSAQRTAVACVFAAIVGVCLILSMPGILNVINNLLQNAKK